MDPDLQQIWTASSTSLHAVMQKREAVMQVVQIMSQYNSYKPKEKLYIISASQPHLQFSEVLLEPSQFKTLS